ncbi:MAG TPA: tetratricopeptide repeat protein, partial [Lacipirellulaceae bacterium]|nr:tetratricopeptide repeat protein [Lacipirellulaceae bacterium]
MRNYWHAGAAALCLATGCAGAFGSGADGAKLTASGRPESFKAPQVQQASWTEWITSPFGGGPTPAEKLQRDAIAASQAAEMRNAQFHAFSPGQPTPPPSPALLASMAELHVRNGRIPEARQLFQRALAADPHNVPILLSAARMEDREGRLDVATALYQRAATIQPNNATVANDLGLCLARRGQLAEAENALLRAVQLNPA